ncbi:MAG: NUDIX domain-containing protein [Acidimicrobiia bacterium]|nr:NUDIX domain-containing protein [Acidimicrobiia bacterium]
MRITRRRAYALITRKGKVLLVKNRRGRWTLPGGKAHGWEKLREAVIREVKEETGMRIELRARVSGDHVRHHRAPCAKCVVFEASVKKGDPKPKREIVEVAWVKPDKAPAKLRSYRRKEIRRLLAKVG